MPHSSYGDPLGDGNVVGPLGNWRTTAVVLIFAALICVYVYRKSIHWLDTSTQPRVIIIPVHDLSPKCTSMDPDAIIIFFHGVSFGKDDDWEETWSTCPSIDGQELPSLCWPKVWLPEDLGHNVRILSLSYDAAADQDVTCIGMNLLHSLVHSKGNYWRGAPIVLIGYSFGGLILKSLVAEVHKRIHVPPKSSLETDINKCCNKFLANLKGTIFYSVPHAGSGEDLSRYFAWQSHEFNAVSRSVTNQLGILRNFEIFSRQMEQLSVDFESAVKAGHIVFAFCEGMPVDTRWGILVPYASAQRLSRNNNCKIDDASHLTICKPPHREHPAYKHLLKILKLICKEASKKKMLKRKPHLGHVIGLDEVLIDIVRKLETTPFLAIVGMGGIGKTTLAEKLLEQECEAYELSSFCADVKDRNQLDVLKQVVQDLADADTDVKSISNEHEGRQYLKELVQSKRVLVILDDVDSIEQLTSLFDHIGDIGHHSKVLVTTQDWGCVEEFVEDPDDSDAKKFNMGFLNHNDAKTLFCQHAFKNRGHPGASFERVVNKVVAACGGLPLSLEVMGSFLRTKKELEDWNQALSKLQEAEPLRGGGTTKDKLWKRLRISVEDLAPKERKLFMDIACFFCDLHVRTDYERSDFRGMKVETTLRIWAGASDAANIELQNLINRSLVKLGDHNVLSHAGFHVELKMHNQLRDMGRSIANLESSQVGIWLWNSKLTSRFLQIEQGNARVQALYAESPRKDQLSKALAQMRHIRLLHLGISSNTVQCLTDCFGEQSRNISWLFIDDLRNTAYGEEFLKRGQSLTSILEVGFGYFSNLRVLRVSAMSLTVLPDSIGLLTQLRELDLTACLVEVVPESIGALTQLQELNLSRCNIKALPQSICKLTSLQVLNLNGCQIKEDPSLVHIGKLNQLRELNLGFGGAATFSSLPFSLTNMTNLQLLSLILWQSLEELPDSIGRLIALETLSLSCCTSLTRLPCEMGNLTSLKSLDLSFCRSLKLLPDSLAQLTALELLILHRCEATVPKGAKRVLGNQIQNGRWDFASRFVFRGMQSCNRWHRASQES